MNSKKLLVVGGGDLCMQLLKLLTAEDTFTLYVAGRDLEKITRSCNLLRLASLQRGRECALYPTVMDLAEGNVEENSATLLRIRPDIIFNCASLHSWRVITQLPSDLHHALDQARFGPWLPMQLAPAYELMRAVKHSGIKVLTVNAAFPDAVNTVLDKAGLAPDTGTGGIANLIPALRLSVARLAMQLPESVHVRLVAQQQLGQHLACNGMPQVAHYRLSYAVNGLDCTGAFDESLIFNSVSTHFRSLGGVNINFFNAISAARVLENLHGDTEIITHVPGPHGLPGGYPVRVGMGRVLLALPYGVSRVDAIAVNQLGQRQDGIDAIHADASVTFTSPEMAVMEQLLGFSMSRMQLQDVHQWARELAHKYQAFALASRQNA